MSLLLLIVSVAQGRAEDNSLTLLTPADGAYVRSRTINVVVELGDVPPQQMRVAVNGYKYPVQKTDPKQLIVHFRGVPLDLGENKIVVSGSDAGKQVAEQQFRIFRQQDLFPSPSDIPDGFSRYYFHNEKHEKPCLICHIRQLSAAQPKATAEVGEANSPCAVCHKQVLSGSYIHGPAAVWSCRMCHSVSSANTRFDTPRPSETICATCHDDAIDDWKKDANMHGPTAMGGCTICHNPHSSDEEYFLRRPTTDLCGNCHENKVTQPHVITFFTGKGHPIFRRPDPFHPGRDFTCASCHNPHASNHRVLLNFNDSSDKKFCSNCHKW